ncbi:MAG: ATP-binding protein [Candidatus Electryonea clarkiae]|nr:ATP-binding protein [Candidatus Electryonea clarkiae]MDP8288296.1 ATP-binding protein [Candidatus Electryonea clarkiae]
MNPIDFQNLIQSINEDKEEKIYQMSQIRLVAEILARDVHDAGYYKRLSNEFQDIFGAAAGCLFWERKREPSGWWLEAWDSRNINIVPDERLIPKAEEGIFRWVIDSNKPLLHDSLDAADKLHKICQPRLSAQSSVVLFPLMVGENQTGMFILFEPHFEISQINLDHHLEILHSLINAGVNNRHQYEILQNSEEDFRDLIENASDMVIVAWPDGMIRDCNRALIETLDLTHDPKSKHISELLPEKDVVIFEECRKQLLEGKPVNNVDISLKHESGRIIEAELSGSARVLSKGKSSLIRLYLRDITQRKLSHRSQKLESIGLLAGGVAHDFNNLLTIIMGNTDLALAKISKKEMKLEELGEINDAAKRASVLTKQLLAFGRKQVLKPRVLNLNSTIRDVHKLLRRLISEDIELTVRLSPDLSHSKFDPSQIEQVILNLVVNARDAMPEGGQLVIETQNAVLDEEFVETHPGSIAGDYVAVMVRDTGTGMPESVIAQIFDPFFTTKDVDKGTGLGLSTVFGIVKQSKGYITVESVLDEGTVFTVYLSQAVATTKLVRKKEKKSEIPVGSETILFVEDEEGVREWAIRVLEIQGYKVEQAASGDEAYKICMQREKPVDLVISDVVMPKISGPELIHRLKTKWPEMKALFISGYPAGAMPGKGDYDYDVPFMQKPFTHEELAEKVREILDS